MLLREYLFGGVKQCAYCGKRLPDSYQEENCPNCIELLLLHEVKDYVRAHDVNEFQVAEEFHIPLRMVKGWIKEGHLEYKVTPEQEQQIRSLYCENCGCAISFGTLCPKCLQEVNKSKVHGYAMVKPNDDAKRMHHRWSDRR